MKKNKPMMIIIIFVFLKTAYHRGLIIIVIIIIIFVLLKIAHHRGLIIIVIMIIIIIIIYFFSRLRITIYEESVSSFWDSAPYDEGKATRRYDHLKYRNVTAA